MHVTVDSEKGLIAYMNVFMRCNELVRVYQMTRFTGVLPTSSKAKVHHHPRQPNRLAPYTRGGSKDLRLQLRSGKYLLTPDPLTSIVRKGDSLSIS
eukprot:7776286-Pyramimonas_sp.AAC.2